MATVRLTNQVQSRPISTLICIGLTQVYAFFSAWAIFSGEQMLRAFALGSVALAMIIPLLINFQAGLMALIIFEPFRGLLRRMQYLFVPYSQNEPIHLITPFVTLIAFVLVIQREKLEMFFASKTAKLVTFLAAICFLQIFNPLQGSLFIGLTGALFYLVPMAWFYFGQTISEEFFIKTLKMIVILGMITSVYGIYQIVVGYPDFERYWIENTDQYSSIAVYNVTRGLATFSNAEEWGRYALLGSLIAFGLALVKSEENKRPLWIFAGVFLCGMLVLSGQRSSIFGLLLGVAVLFVTGARSFRHAFARLLLLFAPIMLLLALSSSLSEDDIYEMDDSQGISTMLSHTTKGAVNPTGEGSLAARLTTWNHLLTETLPSNPFGAGLGANSMSVAREGGEKQHRAIDNHFFSLAVSAGIPAMILLIWILFRSFRLSIAEWGQSEVKSDQSGYWRIVMALLSTFVLNNFFGTSFVIYSVAPVGWLLLGWISSRADSE
jgi:hypothetical protein